MVGAKRLGMNSNQALTSAKQIERSILFVRGQRVILDAALATLYGVQTKALVQAVKRNKDRFPCDFMFQLDSQELGILRSQIVTSSEWGGRRYPPYAFTEQGVAMLSSVLRSPRAVSVNVEIMRTFVRLRSLLASHEQLAAKLASLEKKYDVTFRVVFDAIRALMEPATGDTCRIGFHIDKEKSQ